MNKKIWHPLLVFCCLFISVQFFLHIDKRLQGVAVFKTSSQIVSSGPSEKKRVALTFDDGPHPIFTPQILDILAENEAKATFFVLGMYAQRYPDIIKRQAAEGHEIGNHTFTHIDIHQVSKEQIEDEFLKTQEIIFSLTGSFSSLFRPPYGLYDVDILNLTKENNTTLILWSTFQDSKDWSNPGINKIVDVTVSKIQNGDIILFHDYVYKKNSHTVEALKIILPKLKEEGYEFVTVSELLENKDPQKASE
ncbi:MAG: polysaccharide deacetylase family protein [Epulopiscium sp.]|nr:polysaccharide deacetylase family protein [Candidatus Epulonipiscium sp.]